MVTVNSGTAEIQLGKKILIYFNNYVGFTKLVPTIRFNKKLFRTEFIEVFRHLNKLYMYSTKKSTEPQSLFTT